MLLTCFFLVLDLRKQARHLENDIDLKLVAFSKIGAGVNTPHGSDTVPLLSGEHMFDSLALEIQQLLNKVITLIYFHFN